MFRTGLRAPHVVLCWLHLHFTFRAVELVIPVLGPLSGLDVRVGLMLGSFQGSVTGSTLPKLAETHRP